MKKKWAIADLNAPNGSRDIPFQLGIWTRWTSPFCRFLASFSLKYDVTDAILQDIEKMKVEYLKTLLFDLFEIRRLLEVNKQISLDFKFRCYGNSNENN